MELDPVEVLNHLKALGYEHVEPHLLQKFMKDLKKLIKYEKQKSRVNEKGNVYVDSNSQSRYLLKERKGVLQNNQSKNVGCFKNNSDVFERLSRPNSKTKLCSKAVSTVGVQTDLQFTNTKNKVSSMLRRKQMDPVSLHQFYRREWQNHKTPGENNHDQLRWKIRQMMIDK